MFEIFLKCLKIADLIQHPQPTNGETEAQRASRSRGCPYTLRCLIPPQVLVLLRLGQCKLPLLLFLSLQSAGVGRSDLTPGGSSVFVLKKGGSR